MQQTVGNSKILRMPKAARLSRGLPSAQAAPKQRDISIPKPSAKQAGDHRALEASLVQTIQNPPETLVKTWMWMMSVCKDRELNLQGRNRLMDNFGSIEAAVAYMKEKM